MNVASILLKPQERASTKLLAKWGATSCSPAWPTLIEQCSMRASAMFSWLCLLASAHYGSAQFNPFRPLGSSAGQNTCRMVDSAAQPFCGLPYDLSNFQGACCVVAAALRGCQTGKELDLVPQVARPGQWPGNLSLAAARLALPGIHRLEWAVAIFSAHVYSFRTLCRSLQV